METVSSMQSIIPLPGERNTTVHSYVPVIHFGLIDFDYSLGFATGGYSRVYFGRFKNEKVAIKLLFVMELNQESIRSFYEEAQILFELQHERIVECKGVMILPPAIGVVMPFYANGSLFSYLYDELEVKNSIFVSKKSRESYVLKANANRLSKLRGRASSAALLPNSDQRPSSLRSLDSDLRISGPNFSLPDSSSTNGVELISSVGAAESVYNLTMMLDAARAVEFLHSKNIMHCDIKSLNFLVADVRYS